MAPFTRSSSTRLMATTPNSKFIKKPSAPAASKAAPKAAPKAGAAKVAGKPKKDMTWGGRPDPTPEIIVVAGTGLNAPWRLNQKP